MKIGIVGLPLSGKTTLFNALTGASVDTGFSGGKEEAHHATVKVPDERLDRLNDIYQLEKKVPAVIEYIDLAGLTATEHEKKSGFSDQFLGHIRTADAILVLLRQFKNESVPHPLNSIDPVRDLASIEAEFILSDLNIIENRMTRLQKEMKAKKNITDVREYEFLQKLQAFLEQEKPLRELDISDEEERIVRGYQFLTQKPLIICINIGEEDLVNKEQIASSLQNYAENENSTVVAISAQLEMEIQQLSEEDARVFREDIGIEHSAMDTLIRVSYDLLGLISFFTVGKDQVRAWTIPVGTKAPQAAGAIHTDFERGFIRAEVVHYDDFMRRKNMQQCKADGVLRLEGKDYVVKDGDIINFRFAV